VLVGESQHFRLYVDPDAEVPPGFEGTNGLDALETEWADVQTMLQMPDGKISYYWLSDAHVAAACAEADEAACTWEQDLEIDAPALPNPHELNHAYAYLRKQRKPIPFLAEGIAESIGCEFDFPAPVDDVPWEGVVAEPASADDLSIQGGPFVRYLIRTYGVEAFLRYYEQSPQQRDPALFAANFQSFWNLTMDDVWAAFHPAPGSISEGDTKICPCSLPPLVPSGAVPNDPARAPYWVLPDPGDETFALTGGALQVAVKDCAGIRAPLVGQNVLARLGAAEPRYVLAPLARATLDSYLADTCDGAAPYPIPPPRFLAGNLTIAVSSRAASAVVYLDFASSFSGVLRYGLQQICDSCAFDQGSCQPIDPRTTPVVHGPFYGRAPLHGIAGLTSDVLWSYVDMLP
ncbi:MAG TPA: hypothetical protein VLT58_08380, partial [Polyangia bacterium]|nr:hypothetical protein [Polyangia bacterium]